MSANRVLKVVLFLLLVVISVACSPIRYDGPYKGRVIDAETRQPIESAVVLGVWYKELPSPGGSVGSYFDAQETLTDKNGDFELKGQGLQILSTVSGMHVLIFKAGYEYVGMGMWESLKIDGGLMHNKAAWEGDRAIIPIRKLTMEERKKSHGPPDPPSKASLKKVILMLKEIDKDDRERGLETRDIWNGEKYE
jgi:hypothetical protein